MTTTKTQFYLDPTDALPSVEKLLYSLAWRFANTYSIPFEVVLSECHLGYMNALRGWQPGNGSKFSSYLYKWVYTDLLTFITKRANDPMIPVVIEDHLESFGFAPEQRSMSMEVIEGLSADAREIVSLLVESPEEVLGCAMPATARQLMTKVKKYLAARWNDNKRVERAQMEIQRALQEAWA